MASLRSRLIAVLLVVAAVGLLALAAITYAEQRNFLYDRVDQQVQSSQEVVARALGGQDPASHGGGPGSSQGCSRSPRSGCSCSQG